MKRFLLSLTVLLLALCTGCGNDSGGKDHTPANVGEGKDSILTSENSGAGENDADQMPGDEAFDPEAETGNGDATSGAESGAENEDETFGAESEAENEDETPGVESEAGYEDDVTPEAENHVLLTVEAPLADGRILTLEVVGKRVDGVVESYGVYEVRVYDGDMLIQTVFTAERYIEEQRDSFSDHHAEDASKEYWEYWEQLLSDIGEELSDDEIDSLPEYEKYTECWSIEDTVDVLDLNFDGNADFGLFGFIPNGNIPYYYWAWDEEEERYCYIGTMQGVVLHPEDGELRTEGKVDASSWARSYYRPDENGDLWIDRREIVWSPLDLMLSRVSDSGPMREVWVPRDGEKFSPRSVPAYWKDSFVLIQREVLVKEVYDDGDASYFWEIWELEGGELKLTSREPYVLGT